MATHTQVLPDSEPTPEFDSQCLKYVNLWQQGDLRAAQVVTNLKQLAEDATQSGHLANQGRAYHLLGYIQHYQGNLSGSIAYYDKARRLFDRVGNRKRVATMDLNQGENYRYRGEHKRARRLYQQAYNTAQALDDVRLQTIAIANEGLTLISLEKWSQAGDALYEGLALSEQWADDDANLDALRTEVYFGLAQVALQIDTPETAWASACQALITAETSQSLHSVGLSYRILGDVLTVLSDIPADAQLDTPDEYYRAALDTFREIDAEAEIARTIFSHANSLAKRKRRTPAAKRYREAMATFSRLGMTSDAAIAAEAQLRVI
ncbi:MAG: tetratricopeptide repeat protein [Chloroflexota bacterium]